MADHRVQFDLNAFPLKDHAFVARALATGQMVLAAAHVEHVVGLLLTAALSADSERAGFIVVGESFEWRRARLVALVGQMVADDALRSQLLDIMALLQQMMRRRNLAVHGLHGEDGEVANFTKRNWFREYEPDLLTTDELRDLAYRFHETGAQLLDLWDALHAAGLLFFPRPALEVE